MISLRKIQAKIAQKIYEAPLGNTALYGYHIARSALYHLESLPVVHLDLFIREGRFQLKEEDRVELSFLAEAVQSLYKRDLENMEAGFYNAESLLFENPLDHIKTLNKVFWDSLKISLRKKKNITKAFSETVKEDKDFKDLPEYYKRNFHFQTDGYLSEESAEIYNHQVEILFKGTSNAMRRLVLPPIVKHFNLKRSKPVRFFEAGCGNGVSTFAVANKYKKVQVKATDLSKEYLNVAKRKNTDLKNVSWSKADATSLLKEGDSLYDAWYSVFMFHEMPREERVSTLKEAFRILKPGGVISIVDSIQRKDIPDFDFMLDSFPKNFHEPYYKNYTLHPLEEMLKEVGFTSVYKDVGFTSKVVSAVKPE